MSKKIKDGGAAFPSGVEEVKCPQNGGAITSIKMQPANKGMTLRDYFAAKAMLGLDVTRYAGGYTLLAEHAYKIADAMLAERECGE